MLQVDMTNLLARKWQAGIQQASEISSALMATDDEQRLRYCGVLSHLVLNVTLVGCSAWRTRSFPMEAYLMSFWKKPPEAEIMASLATLNSICEDVVGEGLNDRLSGKQFCYAISAFECYFRLLTQWQENEFVEFMTCLLEVQDLACYALLDEVGTENQFNSDWVLKRELIAVTDLSAGLKRVCWKQYPSLVQTDLE